MEVKVVIAPSPEMVSLVQSVLAVFTANNLVDKVAEMQKFAAEQKAPVFEGGMIVGESTTQENVVNKYDVPETIVETKEFSREALKEAVEKATQPEPTRKRRTKAEIEAEKAALTEQVEALEEVTEQLAEGQQVESISLSSTEGLIEIIEKPTTEIQVPSVVKLRKMTMSRAELIGDIPTALKSFGYESVTALAKDGDKAIEYYNYLIGLAPITPADNE